MTNKKDSRPLSPHLQIYAWNISSFASILHRATGVLLYFSIIAISWYVVMYTYNINNGAPQEIVQEQCDCWFRNILQYAICVFSIGIIFSLYYHFCNGIRHLFWDIGKGFELTTARRSAIAVILIALLLTLATAGFVAYFKFL
ncbi:MAG TPA: succinate dehydrogenase, cytochrome b556 subunit [Rickettsiales bacterium]|nr:succinate dehydrogenase, cytochrome b556 subunit [Rickettsiales bacterium]